MLLKKSTILVVYLMLCGFVLETQAQTASVFTAGLSQPTKIMSTANRNLLVTETSGAPNSGRVSIIDTEGNRRTLIDGLPSGISPEGPSGPTGLEMRGRSLFVAIGQGDGVIPGPAQGTMIPNPNPSSPLLSSVLRIDFSAIVEMHGQGFSLSPAQHNLLANGGVVTLRNGSVGWIEVSLVADFPNSVPNPLPFFAGNVRQSNPFALAAGGDNLYVIDSGMNSVVRVNISSGEWRTLTVFPPRPNPLPFGPPVIEAVPDGIRIEGNRLLVTLLTGFPFVPGLSEVRQVDARTGAHHTLIGGRSSAIDVLEETTQHGQKLHFVLEFSTNLLASQPGQLLAFEAPFYPPQVIASGLISPSGMTRDQVSGDIYITEIFTGRIIRVQMPQWMQP